MARPNDKGVSTLNLTLKSFSFIQTMLRIDFRKMKVHMCRKMNHPTSLACRVTALTLLTFIALGGCSHTVKMYEGGEKDVAQLAAIYPHAGNDPVGIRYLNDRRIPIHTVFAVAHVLPGPNKLTLVHFNTTASVQIVRTTWTMYEVPIDLQAGYTYVAWTGAPSTMAPEAVCVFKFSHADFSRLYGKDPRNISSPSVDGGTKVACGGPIDAKEYVKLYGHP